MGNIIAVAESMTGGGLCRAITSLPGVSKIFEYGFITYSDKAKQQILGVKKATLDKYTAVSAEVALEMAVGVKKLTGADIAVSVTGEAGPESATDKPIGTVFVAINETSYEFHFDGERDEIRRQCVEKIMELIYDIADS